LDGSLAHKEGRPGTDGLPEGPFAGPAEDFGPVPDRPEGIRFHQRIERPLGPDVQAGGLAQKMGVVLRPGAGGPLVGHGQPLTQWLLCKDGDVIVDGPHYDILLCPEGHGGNALNDNGAFLLNELCEFVPLIPADLVNMEFIIGPIVEKE